VNASSHIVPVSFDAKGLVANAGLLLPATLGERLGLPELLRQHVQLGKVAGAANPDVKALTLIASLLAGGECVEDVNVLRAGRVCAEVLGVKPAAASTVGTFLRAFTSGHARQLDAVQEDLHQRAWAAGARPAERVVKLDLDSTVIETYGLLKQGGKDFTYLNTRGYHRLLAVIAETGEVVHSRLREGRASSGRGASSFARQALARLKRLGLIAEIVVRADSGFYAEKVVAACRAHSARFSISVRLQKSHHQLIAAIPEEEWKPIP
jgi:Transposase DDE domain group 1